MMKTRIPWRGLQNSCTAIAAFLTAVTGLYLAIFPRNESPPTLNPDPSSQHVRSVVANLESNRPVIANTYNRTPWMGLELYQNDRPIEMRSRDENWSEFDATLDSGSFELRFSRASDGPAIGILAWHDASIFELVRDEKFIVPGTGIAGARFATPILYLDNEGFNYFDTERMKHLGDDQYAIFISTMGTGKIEIPLARFSGPIYLVVFRVEDHFSMEVPRHSYEFITLQR